MRHFFSNRIRAVLIISLLIAALLAILSGVTGKNIPQMLVQSVLTPLRTGANAVAEQAEQLYDYIFRYEALEAENQALKEELAQLQQEGFQIVAATEKSRKLLYDADFRKPTVLVMGAEDTGISPAVLKLCDEQLAIPMIGHIASLNVSAAAAVMLFEVVRQRIG